MPVDCCPQRIEHYLKGESDTNEASWVETHLNTCAACRTVMQEGAGSQYFWTTLAVHLQSHETAEANTKPRAWFVDRGCHLAMHEYLDRWLQPSPMPGAIGRLATYDVLSVIGQGGMGLVLRAFDLQQQRVVAIKTLQPHLTQDPLARKRFQREAQSVATLQHEHLIDVIQVGDWAQVPFLVMPFYEHGTLADYIVNQPVSPTEVLEVARQTASGLAAAHAAGLVHRDIKPSNVLLADGLRRVVIADFGLVKVTDDSLLTRTEALLGTPQFMSPEQAKGELVDSRSDMFSLGSVMYWMFCQVSPFQTRSSLATLHKIASGTYQAVTELRPDLPDWTDDLLARLLTTNAEKRYTAEELVACLGECLVAMRDRPGERPKCLPRVTSGPINRRWIAVSLAAVLLSVAMIGTLLFVFYSSHENATGDSPKTQPTIEQKAFVATTNQGESRSLPPHELTRIGPLDTLDEVNLRDDLKNSTNVTYWLRRIRDLSADEVPAWAIPEIQELSESGDEPMRTWATEILNKNPFQVVENHDANK